MVSVSWARQAASRAKPRTAKAGESLKVTSDLAQQLKDTDVWRGTGGRKKAGAIKAHEPRRVNIVSSKLCDDIVQYLGPSLERHRGCDLVDLNPGAGLWSRKLHEFLEPRKHVMLERDAELYKPFLGDLLAKENVHMIPRAGILWKDLVEVIQSQLSHQASTKSGEPPQRNDTLLVTANLSMHPKKAFMGFDSLSTMVTYQLMSSIRTSSLFQHYGLVRMLVWVNDEEKRRLIPRSCQRRKRSSFEAELACDWVHEVAGIDVDVEDRMALRDEWINTESGLQTLQRMNKAGLVMPPGRETKIYTESLESQALMGQQLAGMRPPTLSRPFKQELEELEEELKESKASTRLKYLRSRSKMSSEESQTVHRLIQARDAAFRLWKESPDKFPAADAAWNDEVDGMKKNARHELISHKDGYHLFRQNPPALLWDRRAYEPLSVRADEFFPNAPTALLDIQPKTMHPLLLQYGPDTDRAGAMSDVMLRSWWNQSLLPVQNAMESICGGFGELMRECPSLLDPERGGSPMSGRGMLTARSINGEQWVEIMQAWMNWPFRLPYFRLLARMEDEGDAEEDEKQSAMGVKLGF